MTPRRALTAARTRRILIAQAWETGTPLRCCLCAEPILPGIETIMEHRHALALDGPDDDENPRLAHKSCADRKTNGTRATTAGSDKHAIAKGRRLRGETGQGRRKAKIPSRPLPKGQRKLRG